jgi:hypothetical protein
MAEKLASCEMLHLHGKLGVAPLHIVHTLERSPRRGQTLNGLGLAMGWLSLKPDGMALPQQHGSLDFRPPPNVLDP